MAMDLSEASAVGLGWDIRSIGDVCLRVTSGGTPSRRTSDFYSGRWPWVKTQELKDGWLTDTEEHITDDAVRCSSAKVLPSNTILLAMYGATVGKLGLVAREMTCNQACCALVVDDRQADYRFVYYLLLNARSKLTSLAVGAAQQNLSGTTIKSLRFAFPPLHQQRAIASVLRALDDKIELNRKVSATLEAMARALFKSWFVDFDPVRAKVEGCDSGLPPEIAALFPSHFLKSTELGESPAGWNLQRICDIASASRLMVSPLDHADEDFDHYSIPAFDTSRVALIEAAKTIKSSKFIVPQGAVLLSRLNPRLPRVWMSRSTGPRRAICSTEFAVMSPRIGSTEWLYCLFSSDAFFERFAAMVTGTSGSHQRVKPESLLAMLTVVPPEPIAKAFTDAVAPLLSRVAHNEGESATLTAIRDALLPKLISGDVRVHDAERVLEQSA